MLKVCELKQPKVHTKGSYFLTQKSLLFIELKCLIHSPGLPSVTHLHHYVTFKSVHLSAPLNIKKCLPCRLSSIIFALELHHCTQRFVFTNRHYLAFIVPADQSKQTGLFTMEDLKTEELK